MNDRDKEDFKQLSAQIRWVKQQKSQAYRENRLDEALNYERDLECLRNISNHVQGRVVQLF